MRKPTSPYFTTVIFLFAICASAFTANAQQVRIVHIDVGQGDSTLIVGPERTLLFDAGIPGPRSRDAIRNVLTSLGLNSVDFFVAGHYHADHIGAIDELINAAADGPLDLGEVRSFCRGRGASFERVTNEMALAIAGTSAPTIRERLPAMAPAARLGK